MDEKSCVYNLWSATLSLIYVNEPKYLWILGNITVAESLTL